MINWADYPNFSEEEFRCKCGCAKASMDKQFIDDLQVLRNIVGFPLPINSGYRCPEHNNAVSGTGYSGPHTTGKAADLGVDRQKAHKVLQTALSMGFAGIGVAQKGSGRFIHLDTLDEGLRPTVWSY